MGKFQEPEYDDILYDLRIENANLKSRLREMKVRLHIAAPKMTEVSEENAIMADKLRRIQKFASNCKPKYVKDCLQTIARMTIIINQ
jgi:hypothetical protein